MQSRGARLAQTHSVAAISTVMFIFHNCFFEGVLSLRKQSWLWPGHQAGPEAWGHKRSRRARPGVRCKRPLSCTTNDPIQSMTTLFAQCVRTVRHVCVQHGSAQGEGFVLPLDNALIRLRQSSTFNLQNLLSAPCDSAIQSSGTDLSQNRVPQSVHGMHILPTVWQ